MSDWSKFKEHLNEMKEEKDFRLYYFIESGAKLYGFDDEDSDVDVRGIVVDTLENKLSLGRGTETISGEIGEIDYDIHELEKFMSLLYKGNFNVIEWLFSPHIFDDITEGFTLSEYDVLRDIAKKCIHYRTGNHVRGWSKSIYKMDWSKPKKCLYALRPMMVYIYFCKTGNFQSNITELIKTPEFIDMKEHINNLIALKILNKKVPDYRIEKNKVYYDKLKERTKEVEEMLENENTIRLNYDRDLLKWEINRFLVDTYKYKK